MSSGTVGRLGRQVLREELRLLGDELLERLTRAEVEVPGLVDLRYSARRSASVFEGRPGRRHRVRAADAESERNKICGRIAR
jgi:hypothetical protein